MKEKGEIKNRGLLKYTSPDIGVNDIEPEQSILQDASGALRDGSGNIPGIPGGLWPMQ